MAGGLLYFMPGAGLAVTLDDVRAAGLGHAFDARPDWQPASCTNGPGDSGPGVVLADADTELTVGYYPNRQTWIRCIGRETWVGLQNDKRPGPADLARRRMRDGYPVRLGDGNAWTVPVVRWPDGSPRLPAATRRDDQGRWIRDGVLPQHQALWDLAGEWWEYWIGMLESAETAQDNPDEPQPPPPAGPTFDFTRVCSAAVAALALNYRIDENAADLLGLMNGEPGQEVLEALIDWPLIRQAIADEMEKKTAAAAAG